MPTDSGGPYTNISSLFQVGPAEARPIEAIANANRVKDMVVLMMERVGDFADSNLSSQLVMPRTGVYLLDHTLIFIYTNPVSAVA